MTTLTCDFNRVPLGLLTNQRKLDAWQLPAGMSITDGRPDGKYWNIMPDGPDGNFCRMTYPGGKFGTLDQFYLVNLGHVADLVTVKYRHRWVSPLDMRNGPGKQAPCIEWGPNQGSHANSLQQEIIWEASVKSGPKRRNLISQKQNGAQLVQPPFYTTAIVPDVWDDIEMWITGGPDGSMGWKLSGVVQNARASVGSTVLNDSVQIAMRHFSGGGAPVNAADMFADISGITVQIGAQSAPVTPITGFQFIRK